MISRKPTALTKQVVHEFLTDNYPHPAAAIFYYFLFLLFPLTLAMMSVIGFILKKLLDLELKLVDRKIRQNAWNVTSGNKCHFVNISFFPT